MNGRHERNGLLWALGLGALAVLLASCASHASQDSLKPQGPYAREIKNLFVPVFWVAAGVFFIVEGGFVYILMRYRHRKGRDRMPLQTHGNTRLEIGWTILPALVLAAVMVPTVATIWDLARKPPAGALDVTVEGHQWWWGFRYTDPDMKNAKGGPTTTADVLVIPTGRPVYLSLESVGGLIGVPTNPDFEVIHSFWVPELAGKQDVIPGRPPNHILMQADHPGLYYGQCAEFCGLSHGLMRVRVLAMTPSDFATWAANEKLNAVTPTDALAQKGMQLFLGPLSCIQCHTIQGLQAGGVAVPGGVAGPVLTHFDEPSHSCFAGCDLTTADPSRIAQWLHDPAAVKPGSKMPNYHLSADEIQALVAYLSSLK